MREMKITYSLSPVNWDVGTVYISRRFVLEVLQSRIARLLSKAGLVAKVKETPNAVLTRFKAVILNEAKAVIWLAQRQNKPFYLWNVYPLQRLVSRSTMALQRSIFPKRAA